MRSLSHDASRILARTGRIEISVQGQGSIASGRLCADAEIADGSFTLDCRYRRRGSAYTADADALLSRIDAGVIAGLKELGTVTTSVKASYTTTKHPDAAVEAKISELTYKGYSYSNIALNAELVKGERLEANIAADDPNAKLLAYAYYNHADGLNNLRMTALANGVDFHALGLSDKKPGYRFAAKANIDASARSIDDITGSAKVFDIRWLDSRGEGLKVNNISLTADPLGPKPSLTLNSDVARGVIKGPYTLSTLVPQLRSLAALFIPALVGDEETHTPSAESGANDFDFELTLLPSQSVTAFFGAPVHVITDIKIRGEVDSPRKRANINIDAPYLVQGTRLLEQTSLYAALDSADTEARLYAATTFPTKKGDMTLTSHLGIADNRIDTRIDWGIARAIPLSGTIDFSTLLRAIPARGTATFPLDARIDFNPGTINFGYETWQIAPSTIDIAPQRIDVSDFSLDAGTQRIDINGTVGDSSDDRIDVALDRIALIDIFETLEIHKVLIGGRDTGRVVAKNLLGGEPEIECPALHVDTIGYQYCTIGNADVAASWDNAAKAVVLDADITGTEGRYSHIFGSIYPLGEGGLDLNFEADSIPIGFLRPFLLIRHQRTRKRKMPPLRPLQQRRPRRRRQGHRCSSESRLHRRDIHRKRQRAHAPRKHRPRQSTHARPRRTHRRARRTSDTHILQRTDELPLRRDSRLEPSRAKHHCPRQPRLARTHLRQRQSIHSRKDWRGEHIGRHDDCSRLYIRLRALRPT